MNRWDGPIFFDAVKAENKIVLDVGIELEMKDINDFIRPGTFDLAYSVLTFSHIENKEKALYNIHNSLKDNGLFVLSVSKDDEWLDYGSRKIELYPVELDEYIRLFQSTGFHIQSIQETECKYATIIIGEK